MTLHLDTAGVGGAGLFYKVYVDGQDGMNLWAWLFARDVSRGLVPEGKETTDAG